MTRWLSLLALFFPFVALAQTPPAFEARPIEPSIQTVSAVEVGLPFSLDATATQLSSPSLGQASYSWDLGDDSVLSWGSRIRHTYEQPGLYTIKLNVRQGSEKASQTIQIIAYTRQGVVIGGNEPTTPVSFQAAEAGVKLTAIPFLSEETAFSTEELFQQRLSEDLPALSQADLILFTQPDALRIFAQWWGRLPDEKRFPTTNITWVLITNASLDTARNQALGAYSLLQPPSILLTRPEALTPLWQSTTLGEIIDQLQQRSVEYQLVDARNGAAWYLPLSRAVTFFVANGISTNFLYLLLAVPFFTFIVAFFRQFVGMKTFGVYAPLMLSVSFLVLGFSFGMVAFVVVLVVSTLIRWVFSRVELLYIPKVSLTLSILALSFFLVIAIGIALDTSLNLSLTAFPMLVMITVSEKFLSNQSASGLRSALINTAETVFVSLVGFFLLSWPVLRDAIIARPEWVLFPLLGTLWLGRFTGLRLSEYIKFRAFFKEHAEE